MRKSSRYYLRLAIAFINRFKLIFLVGFILGIGVFVFLTVVSPNLAISVKKLGVVGEYTPDNLPGDISEMISMGLTTLDKSGHANPGIAESWEVTDGGKSFTFHLKKNLVWQDGTALVANDLKYNFSDAVISSPDKYTLTFK